MIIKDTFNLAFVGVSPDTHENFYVENFERDLSTNFNAASKFAERLGDGLRLPTEAELNMVLRNDKLKKTFVEGDLYMTSEKNGDDLIVFQSDVLHPYFKDIDGEYRVRFVSDKAPKSLKLL